MIIPKYTTGENIFTKIFDSINKIFSIIERDKPKIKGRPRKYTDTQIAACMIYQVKYSIFTLRELKWRINQDDIYIPIAFALTTAEVYDIQVSDILYDINYMILRLLILFSSWQMLMMIPNGSKSKILVYKFTDRYKYEKN